MDMRLGRFEIKPWEIGAVCFLFGCTVGWLLRFMVVPPAARSHDHAGVTARQIVISRDTVVRTVPRPVVEVREARARVKVLRDTIVRYVDTAAQAQSDSMPDPELDTLAAMPFTAEADTIVYRDTISLRFAFPPPRLSLMLRPAADSVAVPRETITITVRENPPWYEEVGKIGGGLVLGFFLRMMSEPRQ